jgi:LPS O-antigen subunit length determinant protein (WzzB/FepE family)
MLIGYFIQQLGSKSFAERNAAEKALESSGEPALKALRIAATEAEDAQARHRASQMVAFLVTRAMEHDIKSIIRNPNLRPQDKGKKLLVHINPGMESSEVYRLL